MNPATLSIRPAMQAGRFYDADPDRLRRQITQMLEATPADCVADRPPLAILAPHAGYAYSGSVAAAAYRQVQGKAIDRVVILAPSHFVPIEGTALASHSCFATPLGQIGVDAEAVEILLRQPHFLLNDEAHLQEHAVEVQLPFLQVALPGSFSILPLTLGRCDDLTLEALAIGLYRLISASSAEGRRWLIVASSDTYHGDDAKSCMQNDRLLAELIKTMQIGEFRKLSRELKVMACGWQPLAVTMRLSQLLGAVEGRLLAQSNSLANHSYEGNYVVGYLAAAFS